MKIFGVVGNPILHSQSPQLFSPWLNDDEAYLKIAADTMTEVKQLFKEKVICGCNVTAPFKEEAFQQCDVVTDNAIPLQSVNTIKNVEEKLLGNSSDGDGVLGALNDIPLKNASVLILGIGGAGRAAAVALKRQGASVYIWNRTAAKAELFAREFGCHSFSGDTAPSFDIVVSTIPECSELFDDVLSSHTIFLDALYSKASWAKRKAEALSARYIGGERWLYAQGVVAATALLDRKIIPYHFALQPSSTMQSIVITGMMGAGKTSVGKALAPLLNLPHVDSDREIESKEKKSIAEMFSQEGEASFREKEERSISEFVSKQAVLSIGGGALMSNRTRDLLKKHRPLVVWLWASPSQTHERLMNTPRPRPLFDDFDARYQQRLYGYAKASELFVVTDGKTPSEIAQRIKYEIDSTRTS